MRKGPIVMLLLLVALAAGAVRAFSPEEIPTLEPQYLTEKPPRPLIQLLGETVQGSKDQSPIFRFFPRPRGRGSIVIDLGAGEVRLYGIYKGNPPRAAMALSELFGEVCRP